MDESATNPQPPVDPVQALSNIEDDTSVKHQAVRWAAEELIAGRSVEELVQQLVDEQWTTDDAEEVIELARKDTRAERGVVTRDDIVRDLNADYRWATGGLSVAFRSGLFGLYGFTAGFMAAVRSVRKLKAVLQRKKFNSLGPDQE